MRSRKSKRTSSVKKTWQSPRLNAWRHPAGGRRRIMYGIQRSGMYILTRAHRSTEMHKKLFSAREKLPSIEGVIGTQPRGFAHAVSVDT